MNDKSRNNFIIEFNKYLKKSPETLIEAFLCIDETVFDDEFCEKILKIFSNPEKARPFEEFVGDPTHLDDISRFFVLLARVSRFRIRLNSMIFK